MKAKANLIPAERIERRILLLRGQKAMLDFQLAELYEVETRSLNQAVKRNVDRFPGDFMFQLAQDEVQELVRSQFVTASALNWSQSVTSSPANTSESTKANRPMRSQTVIASAKRNVRFRPYAFTEQGVAMLSSVLRSPRAIQVNIAIMRTFVQLRRILASHTDLAWKLEALEKKYDAKFRVVFDALRELMAEERKPRREIGFHTLMPKPEKPGGATAKKIRP